MICDKKGYQNRKEGMNDLVGMNKKYKQKFKLYECDKCGLLHIATIHKNTIRGKKDLKYPIKIIEIHYKREKIIVRKPKNKTRSFEVATEKIMSSEMADKLRLLFE